jgi:MoaA/NifB/PqqE/SkfB family radical SAM enzyme
MDDYLEFLKYHRTSGTCNVETSNRCSLKCLQCTRAKLQFNKDSKQYNEIKNRIASGFDLEIQQAKKLLEFFDKGIFLCGQLSDPVLWPNLLEFLELSKNYPDKYIGIHTAASQRNIEWYKEAFSLSGKNVTWKFGIDGLDNISELYRVGQNSKLMIEAMLLAKSMNVNIEWHFIVFKHNEHQLKQVREFSKTYNISLFLIKSNRSGGGVEVPINWQPIRNKEIINDNV